MRILASALGTLAFVVLITGAVLPQTASAAEAIALSKTGDNGLHTQPWFKDAKYDLSEALKESTADGKILALLFEQKGCSYCARMHEENLRDPETVNYIRTHFETVQLDFRGEKQYTHVTGKTVSERDLVREYQVNGTPNIVFLNSDGNKIYRMPGYAPPPLFLAVFQYVKEKGYEKSSIQEWFSNRNQ